MDGNVWTRVCEFACEGISSEIMTMIGSIISCWCSCKQMDGLNLCVWGEAVTWSAQACGDRSVICAGSTSLIVLQTFDLNIWRWTWSGSGFVSAWFWSLWPHTSAGHGLRWYNVCFSVHSVRNTQCPCVQFWFPFLRCGVYANEREETFCSAGATSLYDR